MNEKGPKQYIEEIECLKAQIKAFEKTALDRKMIEAQTRRFVTVLMDSNDAITVQDFDGKIITWNRGAEQIYGWSEAEALEMNIREIVPEDKRKETSAFIEKIKKGELVESFETKRITRDGKILDIWLTATKLVDDKGNPTAIAITERNITKFKKADKVLRQSEERYHLFADSVADFIWTTDMNLRFTYLNHSVIYLLGYAPEELIKQNVAVVLTINSSRTALKAFEEEVAIETSGSPDLSRTRIIELEHVCKDGSTVWGEVKMTFLRDPDKRAIGILGVTRDITERKKMDDKLMQAAEEWRVTFDSIVDLVSIHSTEFKIMRVNKAFAGAFKMKYQEILGKTCYELIHKSKEPPLHCPHRHTARTKEPSLAEFFEPNLGFYLEVSCSPIFNEKGEAMGVVHIAKDITKRKELEKNARLAQLGELVADMAHEVNNPLMIISGNAELSLMEEIQNEKVKDHLKIVVEECQAAKDIIQRLLKFSRPSKGVVKVININNMIEAVTNIIAHQFNLDNIEIKRNYADDLPFISVDVQQVQEIFMNLLNNAKDAMPEGGVIEITTILEKGFVRIDFKDTGCGMTEEVMKRIFEPFFTTKEKGTGLGLSVCYGIVKAHNGELKFESAPRKGTTAIILLPLKEAKEDA